MNTAGPPGQLSHMIECQLHTPTTTLPGLSNTLLEAASPTPLTGSTVATSYSVTHHALITSNTYAYTIPPKCNHGESTVKLSALRNRLLKTSCWPRPLPDSALGGLLKATNHLLSLTGNAKHSMHIALGQTKYYNSIIISGNK